MLLPGRSFPGTFVGIGITAKQSSEIRRLLHQFFCFLFRQNAANSLDDELAHCDAPESRKNG